MPYKIIQEGKKFKVVAQNTGHVAGTHSSKEKAQSQMAALYANEPEAKKITKAEGGYKPTSGMQSAARRALKLKEQGKAKGAGTAVGWTRAGQLARGETLSLSTVKRMYSFFSRHEVDKKGKDWDNAENPSNGKIMWLAWGGDAGFSWSRKIVEREKNMKKSFTTNEIVEEIKDILEDSINPIDTVIEIPDDDEITKGLRSEVTREQLYAIVQHLHEAIESMISDDEMGENDASTIESEDVPTVGNPNGDVYAENWPVEKMDGQMKLETEKDTCDCTTCKEKGISCNECPECMSKSYESDNQEEDKWDNIQKACWTGFKQVGMKEKNGRMVPNCVPVEKMDGQMYISEEERQMMEGMHKSLWNGSFSPDLKK